MGQAGFAIADVTFEKFAHDSCWTVAGMTSPLGVGLALRHGLFGGLDRLGVDDDRRGLPVTSGDLADAVALLVLYGLGAAISLPLAARQYTGQAGGKSTVSRRVAHRGGLLNAGVGHPLDDLALQDQEYREKRQEAQHR